jgi:voltage-gated potassium channel
MEELIIKNDSWIIDQEIRTLHIRDILKVSIIGITEENGNFIQMPKGRSIVSKGSKLLVVGSQSGIAKTKKLISRVKKPKDLLNV